MFSVKQVLLLLHHHHAPTTSSTSPSSYTSLPIETRPIQTTIRNHFPFIWIISNKIHIPCLLVLLFWLSFLLLLLLLLLHLHPTSIYVFLISFGIAAFLSLSLFITNEFGTMVFFCCCCLFDFDVFFLLSPFCSVGFIHYYQCYRVQICMCTASIM